MSALPALIMSRLDVERLERLLENPELGQQAGAALLQAELDRAEVREPQAMPPDVMTMNARAICRDAQGQAHELTLVYPRDADGSQGRVSVLAPVGSALLGLSVGDHIDWPGPNGQTLALTLEAISYQPEAAGDWHR